MIEVGEVWKDIEGYKNLYQVSNYGRVRSLCRYKKILKPCKQNIGYLYVNLYKNGKNKIKKIHRLVAETFIDNPNNCSEVNHIDGNKLNNKVDNLEWCNHSDNVKHSYAMLGRKQKTMKTIYSRNEKGIKKYESKTDAIRYLKTIGYEKCNHARINVAIKTKGVAYGFKWGEKLIDLIEVGDYVNGIEVRGKTDSYVQVNYYSYSEQLGEGSFIKFYKGQINTILTKEQYNQNCYRLEETC